MTSSKAIVRPAVSTALLALALAAPSAHALYGPEGVQPASAPGGFAQIVTSRTITPNGGSLTARVAGAKVTIKVPAGAFDEPLQLRILEPDLNTLAAAVVQSGDLADDTITGVGIAASRQDGEAVSRFTGRIKITLAIRHLRRHTRVLRCDADKGRYVHIHFWRGERRLVVRTLKPQALAVVAPRGGGQ